MCIRDRHIGDKADGADPLHLDAFVQLLGGLHGAPGRKAQLPAGLLLHGGGDEGRRGRNLPHAPLDAADLKGGVPQLLEDPVRLLLVLNFHLALGGSVEPGREALALGRGR